MRIAQITYSYQPIVGGADVYAENLRRVLAEAGYETVVYQRPMPGITAGGAVRFIPRPMGFLRRFDFWTVPMGLRELREELAEFDILIAHYPPYHRPLEWHPRTILLSHGVFWDDRPGSVRSAIKRRGARRAYRRCTAAVANDTFFLREMGEAVPAGAAPYQEVRPGRWYIPNAVDTERFRPREAVKALQALSPILVPRNIFRNRGIHLAIETFSQLAGDFPQLHLVIVGADSDPEYRAACDRRVRDLHLRDRVVFWGPVAWEEMPAVYSSALVTVIPSICGEGTSLAALESTACGTPVVSTDVAGLADLHTVKASPEPVALAAAIRRTIGDRTEMARAQRERTIQVHSLARWRAAWLAVIEACAVGNGEWRMENGE